MNENVRAMQMRELRLVIKERDDEIERLRAEFELFREAPSKLEVAQYEIERLRAALTDIRDLTEHHADADELFGTLFGTARAALTAAKRGEA